MWFLNLDVKLHNFYCWYHINVKLLFFFGFKGNL